MIFTQYYLECLSHASYLIADETTGRGVVVDPQRDVAQYVADAAAQGVAIELVLETHVHADFLSGHLELAERVGATISYGDAASGIEFAYEPLADGQRLSLGTVVLEIRATPGHTPESISLVVWERPDDATPYAVLTGDTLFIGDVGRPDLLSSIGVTADELARRLFHSLHEQLLTLPDETRVFPAHGAGSACGKQLSTEKQSTIGEQRLVNYALQPMTEDEFVAVVTEGQPTAPGYFAFDAARNREARPTLDEEHAPAAMHLDELLAAQSGGAAVLDTRDPMDFAAGHLRDSVNVDLQGRFSEWTGDVVDHDTRIVIVGNPGTELEAKVRLGRIGFDHVVGYLDDAHVALATHPEATERSSRLTARELEARRRDLPDLQILDVRNPGEVALGAIPDARSVPLPNLIATIESLDPDTPTVVYCAGGGRSAIGASVLAARGFADVSDLLGGFEAWRVETAGADPSPTAGAPPRS
ncbi:MAG: MBL fold metallo-hydrolase [Acidimicrobiia bacterium]|nr:MBL fold metallo-hydrolase [Acidimicrobiia bacterium]